MNGRDVCSYKIIPPKTNLKKITVVTDFDGRKKNSYPKDGKFLLRYGKDEDSHVKIIGKGANGIVYLVVWKGKKIVGEPASIVFKYPLTEPGFEVNAAENILDGYHHFIIPHRVIHDQYDNPFVIMQEANGDVFSLLNYNLSKRFRNQIIFHYVDAIGKLWRNGGIVFTDMKTENLLYQCHHDGISLYFGDIGAFSKRGMREYDYEVEPPECEGVVDKNFCLFTIGLLIISIYDFKYTRPKKTISSYEENFYLPLKDQIEKQIGNKNIKKMVKKLLAWNSKFRDENSVQSVVNSILGR